MTTIPTIHMTRNDHTRLCALLDQAVGAPDLRLRGDLKRLNDDLKAARIVQSEEIPADVVTLNSRVVVEDIPDGGESTWVVTFPDRADVTEQRISVLSPLGTALLGSRKGDEIAWESNGRAWRARVKDVLYQPEAAGRYDE